MSRGLGPLPAFIKGTEAVRRAQYRCQVAFADTDAMGVVWHGNYLRYCERARDALAAGSGLELGALQRAGWQAPVVDSRLRHLRPARFGDELCIEALLYPSHQPRLYHRYRIFGQDALLAEAATEQVLVDASFTLVLQAPEWLQHLFYESARNV